MTLIEQTILSWWAYNIKTFFFFFSAKILLFYLIFYAALAGFFAGLLVIFWQTLETDKPKWQLDASLIGSNPGKVY